MRGLLLVIFLTLAGCQGDVAVSPPEQKAGTLFEPREIGSFVRMSQSGAERHFVSGILSLEANAWRWTAKRAVLRVNVKQTEGLKFVMKFAVPEPVIKHSRAVRLQISLNDRPWEQLRYEKDGIYDWEKPVPPELLKVDAENIIAIESDKPLPSERGGPELGFILVYVGLQPLAWTP